MEVGQVIFCCSFEGRGTISFLVGLRDLQVMFGPSVDSRFLCGLWLMSIFVIICLVLFYLIEGLSCSLLPFVGSIFICPCILTFFFLNEQKKRSPQCFLVGYLICAHNVSFFLIFHREV